MQLSQNSNVNFKGIEFVRTGKVVRDFSRKVYDTLDSMTNTYKTTLLEDLESELGADIFFKVMPDNGVKLTLGTRFVREDIDKYDNITKIVKTVPVVNSRGRTVTTTLSPADSKKNWMAKLKNFVARCNGDCWLKDNLSIDKHGNDTAWKFYHE